MDLCGTQIEYLEGRYTSDIAFYFSNKNKYNELHNYQNHDLLILQLQSHMVCNRKPLKCQLLQIQLNNCYQDATSILPKSN